MSNGRVKRFKKKMQRAEDALGDARDLLRELYEYEDIEAIEDYRQMRNELQRMEKSAHDLRVSVR
jgi:hypothetical protein